jgi:hypothetical protein
MIKTFQATDQLEHKKSAFQLSGKQILLMEVVVILLFSFLPLLLKYPYRINIFLSWEGAYRLSMGHVPYRDFGMPLGFAYWLIPALFFKVFGPYLFTLVKAQVLINVLAAFAFRSVLKSFQLEEGKRLVLLVFFCLTYSFINFWPWYNHTVFVYELIGLAFLFKSFRSERSLKLVLYGTLAGVFVILSFLTKQDGGGLAFMLCLVLAAFKSFSSRNMLYLGVFLLSCAVAGAALMVPFIQDDFLYWFNYGQAPHYSRFSLNEILHEFLGASHWLKLYMVVVTLLYANKIRQWGDVFRNTKETLFYLLTMGILVQAAIIQITSYIPADNNIYFHSFALAYVLYAIPFRTSFNSLRPILASVVLIFFWWSGVYYKYVKRVVDRYVPSTSVSNTNVVSKSTYVLNQNGTAKGQNMASWIELPNSPAFSRILMPKETVAGIERLRQMPQFADKGAKVLNMTELTPLAYELGFEPEKGDPLWYHLNVSMFDKELEVFKSRVQEDYYDVVMFEYIPNLNNFYPFELQELLKEEYELKDSFLAPRYQNDAFIEVYVKKAAAVD